MLILPRSRTTCVDDDEMGLRVLIQTSKSNIVFRPATNIVTTTLTPPPPPPPLDDEDSSNCSSFLNTCFLCNKKLKPQMDIYMYRGDKGFCSVECRCRQIDLDEIEELEAATKEAARAYRSRHCQSEGRSVQSSTTRWRGSIWVTG
ncbi:hypothetical protein Scep_025067 [Stephania cephalantha]|uniref:FLZ-type domain-containing protein n=1 Tax=Stephania cephalantha TaxID=152367 RepID=A0AAP0HXP1_9MAGN